MINKFNIVILLLLQTVFAKAQESEVTSALSEIASKFRFTAFDYIATAILAIGLVGVVWNVANNNPHAKEYVISWFVGVLFCLLLSKFIF